MSWLWRRSGPLTGVVLLALTIAGLALALLAPSARLIDIGAPGDAYLAANFYQPERIDHLTFRWSGPNSALQLPALATKGLLISLRLHGHATSQALYLRESAARLPAVVLPAEQEWRVYHVLMAPSNGEPAERALQLVTEPSEPGPSDPRELGVAIDWVRLLLPGGASLSAGARQAALFGWALALLAGALWLVLSAGGPASALPRWRWTLALTGSVAVALLAWAWRDPYALTWLVPLEAGPLAADTVLLVGVWAVAPRDQGAALVPLRPDTAAANRRGGPALARLWPAGLLLLAHGLLVVPVPAGWRGVAALALLWAPGWLLARLVFAHERDRLARLVLGLCGALSLQVILLLACSALPWGLTPWWLVGLCDGLSLVLAARLLRAPVRPAGPTWRRASVPLGLILLLAAGLRLPWLGSAELHDDEASVLIGASQLVGGQPDVLLTQLKGPAQILLPAGPLAISGQLNELTARLPFAVAGLGVVLGAFVLARRIVAPRSTGAGLAAATVIALDGLQIAFSRIVQYQSLVVLLSAGALWCCWRFYAGCATPRRYLAAAALFVGVALLGHYDTIYLLPGLAWLVLAGLRRRRCGLADSAATLAGPVLLGCGLLAGFYLPFVLHPHFAEALAHIGERSGQQGGPAIYNNLASTYSLATFYNTAGQIWIVAGLVLGGLMSWLAIRGRPRLVAAGVALLVTLACLDLARGPGEGWLWQAGPAALALSVLVLGTIVCAPNTPPGLRATLLWLGAGWCAMLFLIDQPRTHVYVVGLPAALLAWLRRALPGLLNALLAAALLLTLLVAGLHQYTLFVRQSPEYERSYPAARLDPGIAAADELPLSLEARFGFPSRDGWKVIGELYRRGVLHGAIASNQSNEVLAWYTRGARRCGADPAYYVIALSAPNPALPVGYHRFGSVQVDGRDQLAIYSRDQPSGPPQIFNLADYLSAFDQQPIHPIPSACET